MQIQHLLYLLYRCGTRCQNIGFVLPLAAGQPRWSSWYDTALELQHVLALYTRSFLELCEKNHWHIPRATQSLE